MEPSILYNINPTPTGFIDLTSDDDDDDDIPHRPSTLPAARVQQVPIPPPTILTAQEPIPFSNDGLPTNGYYFMAPSDRPRNVVDRATHSIGAVLPEQNISAYHALNVFNAAAIQRPRKSMPPAPTSNQQRQSESARMRHTNTRQGHERPNTTVSRAKMQIVPLVKKYLEEFGRGLLTQEITRIGKEVIDRFCDEATMKLIVSNNGSKNGEVEKQLANRARVLTKQQIIMTWNQRNITGARSNRFANDLDSSDHDNLTGQHLRVVGPQQDPQISLPITKQSLLSGEMTSSGSDVDAAFDGCPSIDRRSPKTSPEVPSRVYKSKLFAIKSWSNRVSLHEPQPELDPHGDSSTGSEEILGDTDITSDARNSQESLKTPRASILSVEASCDKTSQPSATFSGHELECRILEREERRYRLFGLDDRSSRPYMSAQCRLDIQRGLDITRKPNSKGFLSMNELHQLRDAVLHVDFAAEEMAYIADVVSLSFGIKPSKRRTYVDLRDEISRIMKGRRRDILRIASRIRLDGEPGPSSLGLRLVKKRGKMAILAFLEDAANGNIAKNPKLVECAGRRPQATLHAFEVSINSLLRQREIFGGHRGSGCQEEVNKNRLSDLVEDTILPYRQWMDCSGDVIALTWNSEGTRFVCGATAHSDSHNQQYNKPGNLIFGSVASEVTRARPDHRIFRPVVAKGENATEAMRETQDPWLYSSVVSAAYGADGDLFFTSSFDKTVKVWGKGTDDTQPELLATWNHGGNVNFVVTSENHGLVATASDSIRDAIRVYEVDRCDVVYSPFKTYSGLKANEQVAEDKTWAYFPATIAWAKCPLVSYLLLVGYSPRSIDINDNDIPNDKINSGELCLWNVETHARIDIWPISHNVFEVAWHPTQPVFLAATAPHGMCEPWVRTQVRVFALNEKGGFTQTTSLDCRAIDINEITVMPNSLISCYVTASCTDGKVYVWDTALGCHPVHVLEHGASIDDRHFIDLPDELHDNGVKFAAWGATLGRFYTGSSDGCVKVWDVRASPGKAFIRDVVRLSGGVSSGAFSPDFMHLLIGDATGKIHLLKMKDSGEETAKVVPKLVTPHPQPAEGSKWAGKGSKISSELVQRGVISIKKQAGAVQGPGYHVSNWYCPSAHVDADPMKPLLPEFARKQQSSIMGTRERLSLTRLPKVTPSIPKGLPSKSDLDLTRLEEETSAMMLRERWVCEDECEEMPEEPDMPSGRLVKKLRKGEDWEDDWVELEESQWVDLDSAET